MNDSYEERFTVNLRKVRSHKPSHGLPGLRSIDTLQGFHPIRNQFLIIRRRAFVAYNLSPCQPISYVLHSPLNFTTAIIQIPKGE